MRCPVVLPTILLVLATCVHAEVPPEPSERPPAKGDRTLGGLLEAPVENAKEPERPRVESAAPEKAEPPSKAALDEAAALIRDLFKTEMGAAKSPAQQSELARTLLKQARASKSDPAGHFVLLEEATSWSVKAGDLISALAAIDQLAQAFQVNELQRKRDVLSALSGTSPPPMQKQIADLALSLIDPAIAADDYALAKDLAKIGVSSARKGKDLVTSKAAGVQATDIDKLAKQYVTVKEAMALLEKEPDDPVANFQAGSFLCFMKGDWSRGLPMLAKGDDAVSKAQAQKDLAHPAAATARLAVGDGWWDLSEQKEGGAKLHLQARAGEWYRKAIPGLTGLPKAKAEKRLAEASTAMAKGGAGAPALPLFAKAQDAVKNGQLSKSRPHGFGMGNAWEDIPEQGGILVGLDLGLRPNGRGIQGIQAVYATPRGDLRGRPIGLPSPRIITLRGKPGFAIGIISIRGGLGIDALSVTFMQMEGDRLNPDNSYKADGLVEHGGREGELSVPGEPIVGLLGHLGREGHVCSLGIVTPLEAGAEPRRE